MIHAVYIFKRQEDADAMAAHCRNLRVACVPFDDGRANGVVKYRWLVYATGDHPNTGFDFQPAVPLLDGD